jgi:hypothetical protein
MQDIDTRKEVAGMGVSRRLHLVGFAVVTLALGPRAFAQTPPPIHGVTGTIATPTTINEEHKLANKIVVAAEDGVEHVFPAGKGPLSDLTPGSTVAVYYESTVTEGIVSDVNRAKNGITLQYADGKKEKLELTEKAAVTPDQALKNGRPAGNTRVVVYDSNDAHGRIARYFKPKS